MEASRSPRPGPTRTWRAVPVVLGVAAMFGFGSVLYLHARSGIELVGDPQPPSWVFAFTVGVSLVVPWILGHEVCGLRRGLRASPRSGVALVLLAFATMVQSALFGLGIVESIAHGLSSLVLLHGLCGAMFMLGLAAGLGASRAK